VRKRRAEQRRSLAGTPVVALVGYTNAGKSSLLNALSGADVLVADQPFATLDPTLRNVRLAPGQEAIVADTVGFISDLPKELVVAFRATLEEVTSARLLLHVIDASNSNWRRQHESVIGVLRDLHAENKPVINVWNKIDIVSHSIGGVDLGEAGVLVSATTGTGIQELKSAIAARLSSLSASASPL
jgi:GTP-binding protein HflX